MNMKWWGVTNTIHTIRLISEQSTIFHAEESKISLWRTDQVPPTNMKGNLKVYPWGLVQDAHSLSSKETYSKLDRTLNKGRTHWWYWLIIQNLFDLFHDLICKARKYFQGLQIICDLFWAGSAEDNRRRIGVFGDPRECQCGRCCVELYTGGRVSRQLYKE